MQSVGYNFWSEWELQEKVDFDGANKLITVYPHVTDLDIRADIWSAGVRWLGMLNRGYDRFLEPLERAGLDTIPGGQTGDFYFLTNGWKLIVDFSKVKVTGVLFSRDFTTAYYTSDLTPQFAAEVSSIVNTVTSGSGLSQEQNDWLEAIPNNPVLTTDARIDNLDVAVSSRSSHSADDVWLVAARELTEQVGMTTTQANELQALYEAHYNRRVHDSNANTITIYEADGVTPKKVFDSNADLSDITPQ